MKPRGFTLLELLVAVTITLLLAGLLLTITTNVLSQMQRAQGSSAATVAAKLVLDQLERDLQGAIMRADGKDWLDARVLSAGELPAHGWKTQTTPPMKPGAESTIYLPDAATDGSSAITKARFGTSGVWLRVLTSDYDSAAAYTVPVAVAYQISRQEVSSSPGAPIRYALYRSKMTEAKTFSDVMGSQFTDTSPSDLIQPSSSDVIASNVVDFGIWFFARNSSGQLATTPIFPQTRNSAVKRALPANGTPVSAELMVRILTEEGASLIQSIEEGRVTQPAGSTPGEWWWQVVESHSQVFTRHVDLKIRP